MVRLSSFPKAMNACWRKGKGADGIEEDKDAGNEAKKSNSRQGRDGAQGTSGQFDVQLYSERKWFWASLVNDPR